MGKGNWKGVRGEGVRVGKWGGGGEGGGEYEEWGERMKCFSWINAVRWILGTVFVFKKKNRKKNQYFSSFPVPVLFLPNPSPSVSTVTP